MENPPHQTLRLLNDNYMKKTEYSRTWKVLDKYYTADADVGFVSAKIDEQKTEETKRKVIALVGKI